MKSTSKDDGNSKTYIYTAVWGVHKDLFRIQLQFQAYLEVVCTYNGNTYLRVNQKEESTN